MKLTQSRLKQLLNYDAYTGVFTWLADLKKVKVGDVAGCVNSRGYRLITVDQVSYRAHRLAAEQCLGFPECDGSTPAKVFVNKFLSKAA